MGLRQAIENKPVKEAIVADCSRLIDEQVAAKTGISGMALKATYGVVKGVGKGYIPGAIGRLLPEAFAALDPMWQEAQASGDPVAYISQHRSRAADTLLSVTDHRIRNSSGVVKGSYSKLRKSVKGDVEAAMPGLAKIIDSHTSPVLNA
ncbi:hypothetical protein C7271_09815 [filamentous cyanobacterium CCP5]|nr:hypothetical protein C7271_09815 [filamentous cyanobacterium CCP5]